MEGVSSDKLNVKFCEGHAVISLDRKELKYFSISFQLRVQAPRAIFVLIREQLLGSCF